MAKEPKIIRAKVTGDRPTFINGVLHLPGEDAVVNVDALGVDGLGKKTPGLVKVSTNEAEAVEQVPIAAVAPHAPDAPNPQGLATGTVQSGTGRLLVPDPGGNTEDAVATEQVGADKPGIEGEQTPIKPTKGK